MYTRKKALSSGFTLVEIIIALAILSTFTVGILASNNIATHAITINQRKSQANRLAREAMEAVLSVRAANFSSLSAGTFHPVSSPSGWSLVSGSDQLDIYTRSITLTNPLRAIACDTAICDIVTAGGITDLNTFKVIVEISWPENGQIKKVNLSNLVTNWR